MLDTILSNNRQIDEKDFNSLILSPSSHEHFNNFTISEGLKLVIAKTQENCNITISSFLSINKNESVGIYLHNSPSSNLGVKGSYVILKHENEIDHLKKEKLTEFSNNLAMHIVAANSKFLRSSDVPSEVLEKEKSILEEQSKNISQNKDISKILKNKLENA